MVAGEDLDHLIPDAIDGLERAMGHEVEVVIKMVVPSVAPEDETTVR
jgi:hypothetical protein